MVFPSFLSLTENSPFSGAMKRGMQGVAPHPTKELFEKSSLETQKLLWLYREHNVQIADRLVRNAIIHSNRVALKLGVGAI